MLQDNIDLPHDERKNKCILLFWDEVIKLYRMPANSETQVNKPKTEAIKQRKLKNGRAPEYVNANTYKHFLAVPATNENYIKWAFGLREHEPCKQQKLSEQVPSTYFKTIECMKIRQQQKQPEEHINLSQFEHLALHQKGSYPSAALLKFQTHLRETKSNKDLIDKEKRWVSIPAKDKHEHPKLLNSNSLKKKVINAGDMMSAVDGQQNYPKFSEKIIKMRNTNQFRHMIKGKVYLPSICWQTNLREY